MNEYLNLEEYIEEVSALDRGLFKAYEARIISMPELCKLVAVELFLNKEFGTKFARTTSKLILQLKNQGFISWEEIEKGK